MFGIHFHDWQIESEYWVTVHIPDFTDPIDNFVLPGRVERRWTQLMRCSKCGNKKERFTEVTRIA